ncbi:MAG: pentapeptide repeat-containing protein [Myxococcales bacterium]|nr:pentapeptide repeat-containing protein [Myxococcales bacterium]
MESACSAEGCPLPAEAGATLCILHAPREGKPRAPLLAAFAALDAAGVIRISGLQLRGACLDGVELELKNLRRSDLTGASIRDARLDQVGFDFSTLDDVNFEGSVLKRVNFRRCESLRRGLWHECLLVDVRLPTPDKLGLRCAYELRAPPEHAKADEVYRHFKELYKHQGDYNTSGVFYELEMDMQRRLAPLGERVWLTALWLLCGYGERPGRSVAAFLCIIIGFALAYTALELEGSSGAVHGDFLDALYFSVVTFTSLGYGDIRPIGLARLLAGVESLLGVFAISLFVFVFCRRMIR